MALKRFVARRAISESLSSAHRDAARLLIELGLVADEVELLEQVLREFIEGELRYVVSEWPEEAVKRKAGALLDRIAWL
ncbi:MAG: hypothetical protein QXV79_02630 [Thermofilaceae archaeon]